MYNLAQDLLEALLDGCTQEQATAARDGKEK